jgi:hypothetical protein
MEMNGMQRKRNVGFLYLLTAVVVALSFAVPAHADLARVGPANTPAPPGHGFPFWYQDLNGLVLDPCLPDASDPGALQQTACLLGPPDPPYIFPTNFPDELFYFRAVSTPLDTGGGKRAILVLALEGAFANGGPVPGDQMVFTRIRVTAGVPVDGDYTVTHPYGTESFPGVTAGVGNRDIVFSEDIGIVAGAFTDALHSRVGPFLQRADALGNPLAPVTLNGAQFLSDGVAPEFVTGSPFDNTSGGKTNYFEICGPFGGLGTNSCIRENTFTLTGRLHNFVANPIGSPLSIDRATYARNAEGAQAQVDVLATASPGIGQAAAKLTAAAPNVSPVLMNGPTVLSQFYAQGIPVPADTIPSLVTVTNSGDVPPTSATHHIVDEVTIPQASWNPADNTMTVVATSSDKFAPPSLAIDGFPAATQVPLQGDPAGVTFTATPVPIPPSAITVVSSAGGQGFATVTMGASLVAFPCGVPFTQDDSALTAQGVAVVIPVLLNDQSNPTCPISSGPVILAPGPNIGTAVVLADGTIRFTPPASTGTATFRYTDNNSVGASNVATVTVDVVPAAGGPVPTANNDGPFTVFTNQSTVLDVLANDTGNGGNLDPATVTITTPPASGNATANANGTITYTAGATTGPATFQYTVANTNGNVSPIPATVTITVTNPQTVTVTLAQYKGGPNPEWRVDGTTSPVLPNTVITVRLFSGAGVLKGTVGTATADAVGAWRIRLKGAGLPVALNGDTVRATSSIPGSIQGTLAVTVR